MLGGIYSDQVCPVCGERFKDDGKRGLSCPRHPDKRATRFSVRFKGVHKRFNNYSEAAQFIGGLRWQEAAGSFDKRDFERDRPLSFRSLAKEWLDVRRDEVRCYRNLRLHIARAAAFFEDKNIKEIGYAELEDFLKSMPAAMSSKSKANIFATLHSFWTWLRKRRVLRLDQMPEWPQVPYELAWRKTVDKETQEAIIAEVKRISYHINPRIWLGIKWLATYISVRPAELLHIKEKDFDLDLGLLLIRHKKAGDPHPVGLLPEDVELVRALPRGFPELYFFRHGRRKGVRAGQEKFGRDYFYVWWKAACKNLGIEGVDLYGGTRHSSARALKEYFSPETIRRTATKHAINKAFARYFEGELEDDRQVYGATRPKAEKVVKLPGKKLVKDF